MPQEHDLDLLSSKKFIENLTKTAEAMRKDFPSLVNWGPKPPEFVHHAIDIVMTGAEKGTLRWDPAEAGLDRYMAGIMRNLMLKLAARPEYRDRKEIDPARIEAVHVETMNPERVFGASELVEACRSCPSLQGCKLREIVDAILEEDLSKTRGWIGAVAAKVGLTIDQMSRRFGKLRSIILRLQTPSTKDVGDGGACRFGGDCMADLPARRPAGKA